MTADSANRFYAAECVHVRMSILPAGELITIESIGEMDADYRYAKGPDRIRVCLVCAGQLMALITRVVEGKS